MFTLHIIMLFLPLPPFACIGSYWRDRSQRRPWATWTHRSWWTVRSWWTHWTWWNHCKSVTNYAFPTKTTGEKYQKYQVKVSEYIIHYSLKQFHGGMMIIFMQVAEITAINWEIMFCIADLVCIIVWIFFVSLTFSAAVGRHWKTRYPRKWRNSRTYRTSHDYYYQMY